MCAHTRAHSHAHKSASLPLRLSTVSAFTSQQLCHFSELMFQPKAITTAGLCLPSHSSVETKIRADQRCVVFKGDKSKSKCGSLLMLPCPACSGRVWKVMGEVGWQLRVVEGRGFSLRSCLASSSSEPLRATSLWSWAARGVLTDDQKLHNCTRKPAGRRASLPLAVPPFAFLSPQLFIPSSWCSPLSLL